MQTNTENHVAVPQNKSRTTILFSNPISGDYAPKETESLPRSHLHLVSTVALLTIAELQKQPKVQEDECIKKHDLYLLTRTDNGTSKKKGTQLYNI